MAYQALAPSSPTPINLGLPPARGRQVGCYIVEDLLGKGGMGEVYRGRDTRLERTVAIKFVSAERSADPRAADRLANEARITSALSHPGIVTVHDIGSFEGRPFIVMEFVEGPTLASRLLWGPLKLRDTLRIAYQVADALAAAHTAGVVHRDLKPQNIMLTADGRAKIVDFGLGVLRRESGPELVTGSTQTVPFSVQGTVGYMAPEQAAGMSMDMRADQFVLGAILYEMLSGRRAFARDTAIQTLSDIIDGEPAPLSQICPGAPPALLAIVDRCLRKDPRERYGSTIDLAHDLRSIAEGPTTEVEPPRPIEPRHPARRWPWAAASAIATAAVIAGTWLLPGLSSFASMPAAPSLRLVAVLPFLTLAGEPADQVLADGLVETLTSSLTMLERFEQRLRVVPSTEVRREQVASAKEARQAFGATLAISGSLQRDGGSLRLTLNLIDAVDLVQLASRAIDLPAGQQRGLQDLVAGAVADLLDLALMPEARQAMTAGGSSAPGAYELLAQARGYLQRFDRGADNVDLAIDALNRAVAADSHFALAHAAAGEAYWRKYELSRQAIWIDRAVQHAEQALSINSRLAPTHVVLSMIARGRGRYEEAVAVAQRAVELDPVSSDAYRELGRAYDALDRPADAEATYRKAVAARPNDWQAYNTLGSFYYSKGRWPEATAAFKQVTSLTPDNTRGYNNLGAAYFGMGQPDAAAAIWEQSTSIRPTYAAASNLGLYYYSRGRYSEAARAFERAVSLSPGNHRLWRNLGAALFWAPGEKDRAAAAYERAVQLAEQERRVNPRQPALQAELADAYSMLGRKADALDAAAAVERLGSGDAETMFNVASAYEQIGERALALQWLQKALAAGYSREAVERSPGLAALRAEANVNRAVR